MAALWEFLKSLFGFAEKAIPTDKIREQRQDIKEPLQRERVSEKLEDGAKVDWAARVKTFDLPPRMRRHAIRHVKNLIEWGAEIESISVEKEAVIKIVYCFRGSSGQSVVL